MSMLCKSEQFRFRLTEWMLRAFEESKHPRDPNGKFGSGGGGGGGGAKKPRTPAHEKKGNGEKTKSKLIAAHEAHKKAYQDYKKANTFFGNKQKKKEAFENYKKAQMEHTKALAEHLSGGRPFVLNPSKYGK
jgi:hypothetical protein